MVGDPQAVQRIRVAVLPLFLSSLQTLESSTRCTVDPTEKYPGYRDTISAAIIQPKAGPRSRVTSV